MKPLHKIASELFGFDRRERRGTYILAVILGLLLILRILIPGRTKEEDLLVISQAYPSDSPVSNRTDPVVLFYFDPNTATAETLERLGLTGRQASTLINYRKAGARFRKPADIFRVYGIDSVFAAELVPWIKIIPEGGDGEFNNTRRDAGTTISGAELTVAEAGKRLSGPGNDGSNPGTYGSNPGTYGIKPEKEKGDARKNGHLNQADIIDLNRCNAADLEKLPGIGEVLSVRIIKYRDLLGGYVSPVQLREVYGLDSATVDLISGRLKASAEEIRQINLDTCGWAMMARHPYLGPEAARAIMKYRSLSGVIISVDDLVLQKVLSDRQGARIAPYVSISSEGPDN